MRELAARRADAEAAEAARVAEAVAAAEVMNQSALLSFVADFS